MTLTTSEPRAQTRYLTAFIISVCLFLIYNLNLRSIDSVDTLPNTLLPVSILKYGDLNLNEFENLFEPQPDVWQAAFGFGALQRNERAVLVGRKTSGASISRELVKGDDGSSQLIVRGTFLQTPSKPISGVGVQPDIEVSKDETPDEVLQTAVVELQKSLSEDRQ